MIKRSAGNGINTTKSTQHETYEHVSAETVIIGCILYSLIALLGTTGNTAVIVVILKRRLVTQAVPIQATDSLSASR